MRAAHAGLELIFVFMFTFSARNDKICVKVPNSLVFVLTFSARYIIVVVLDGFSCVANVKTCATMSTFFANADNSRVPTPHPAQNMEQLFDYVRTACAGLDLIFDFMRTSCASPNDSLVFVLTFSDCFRNVADFMGCRRAAVADCAVLAQTL